MNKTEAACSNQIHQLMVTVSRHFYVSQKGILTYQDKPFTTKINNYQNSKKELLVYYIVIDRYSGNFIFQVATTKQMFALADFLHYAWRQDKEEKHFWGLPDYIAIPKAISSPSLFVGLKQVGVTPFTPTSGFPSGGHIIKAIEDHLWSQLLFRSTLHFKASFEIYKTDFYDVILGLASRGDSRTIWKENLPSGQPNDAPIHQEFIHAFKTKESDSTTLPLTLGDKSTNITTRIPPSTELPHYFVAPVKKLPFSETKLNEANEINNQAWEEDDIIKGIKIAYQALEASPFCADALNYLSLYSKLYSEKCFLSKRAVLVGKEALGELYIKENTGYFWGLLETRPYMRALQGLADCYWHTEDLKPAAEIYQEMLKLNPSDNQGVRYHLGNILILLDRREELDDLLKNYGEEESCFMLYTKALHLYRLGSADATKIVQRAIASNKHVYGYLSGEEFMPYREPEHYCWGEPSEAICYVSDAQEAWEKSPGSIEWLNKNMRTFQQNLMAAEQEVTIEQVLQNFLEEQSSHLSKTTYRKYETVIELLEASMERYSYNYLEENDKQIFDLCLNDQFNKALIEVNGVVKQLEGATVAGNPLQNIGGLVGVTWSGAEISDAHFDGTVTSYGTHSGGLVGNNSGTITASSTSGTVEILTNLNNAGGLVGSNMLSGEIVSSSSTAAINSSGEHVGGLVGWNDGNIIESRAEGCVTASGSSRIGGLVGYNKGSIEGSSAFGNVIATNESAGSIGGLVGYNESGSAITSSHSAGNVTVTGQWISSAGGLVGLNSGSIAESSAAGGVTATGEDALYIGGLIGRNTGTVESSFATGNVEGNTQTGGLVGYNSNRISNCYATGNVSSNGLFVGGLVGTNTGTVEYCYAAGDVEGDEYVGGLVGSEGGFTTLKHSFASGNVIGNDSVGALAGQIAPGGLVRNCGASGDVNSTPITDNEGLLFGSIEEIDHWIDGYPPITGEASDNYILSTPALKQLATFLGEEWSIALLGNFNPSNPSAYIWYIDQGTDYPILWWQLESSGGNGGIDRGTGFRPSSFHFTPLSWAGLPAARSSSALTNIFTSENSIITPAFVSSGSTGNLVRAKSAYQAALQRFEAEKNQLGMKERVLLETELVLAKTAIIALETALLVQKGEAVDLPSLINAYQEALSTLQANRDYFSNSELTAAEALLNAIESIIASFAI